MLAATGAATEGAGGLGGGGDFRNIIALPVAHFRHQSSVHASSHGTSEAPETTLGQCRRSIPPLLTFANAKRRRLLAGLFGPRQFKLVAHGFAVEVLLIFRVHFDRVGGVRFPWRLNCLGPRCDAWRGTRRRVVPEAAMLQYLADYVVLAGLDEGNDLHPAPAMRARQGIDLVNALDQHRPAPPGLPVGRWSRRRAGRNRVHREMGVPGNIMPRYAAGLLGIAAIVADESARPPLSSRVRPSAPSPVSPPRAPLYVACATKGVPRAILSALRALEPFPRAAPYAPRPIRSVPRAAWLVPCARW